MARNARVHSALALGTLALALAACGGEGSSARPTTETWTLEPDLRIGSLDGPDALSRTSDMALGPDGRIFVTQPQEGRVAVFDGGGSPAGHVGQEGEGPGEFLSPGVLGFLADTLWVFDGRQRRLSFFLPSGQFLGSRPQPAVEGLSEEERATFGRPLADGRILMVTSAGFGSSLEGSDHPFPILSVTRDGASPDTLATRYTAHDRAMFVSGSGGQIQSVEILQQVFSDVTLWTVAPDGDALVVVDRVAPESPEPATYTVTRVGLGGDTAWSTAVTYDPLPIPGERIDSIIGRYTRGGRSESEIRQVLFLPEFFPPASDVVAGADGRVWVGREDRLEQPTRWDVFDADGTLIAAAVTPPGFTAHAATATHLWGVETDELDVPYVVRLRVGR